MCRPRTEHGRKRAARLIAAAAAIGLGGWLGGCSDVYWDHRETVGVSSGDAIAANEVTQMVDPWPPNSGNKNIGYNGQKMQVAVERYRTGTVIPPISAVTSDVNALPPAPAIPPPPPGPQAASSGVSSTTTASQ